MGGSGGSDYRDDAAMLAACVEGDEQAWSILVERYTRLLYSIALKSGLDQDDAADVVQNVFTIVLRRLESLREVERFSSWLITTTRRECWRMSNGDRDTPLDATGDLVDDEPSTESRIIDLEHASLVRDAICHLDDRCQQLLTALFLREERPSYDVISADLGIAVGSIGPIRARCLARLRSQLAQRGLVDASR